MSGAPTRIRRPRTTRVFKILRINPSEINVGKRRDARARSSACQRFPGDCSSSSAKAGHLLAANITMSSSSVGMSGGWRRKSSARRDSGPRLSAAATSARRRNTRRRCRPGIAAQQRATNDDGSAPPSRPLSLRPSTKQCFVDDMTVTVRPRRRSMVPAASVGGRSMMWSGSVPLQRPRLHGHHAKARVDWPIVSGIARVRARRAVMARAARIREPSAARSCSRFEMNALGTLRGSLENPSPTGA